MRRSPSGWVAFDDVSLKQVGNSTELAPNTGFENDGGWTETVDGPYPGTAFFRSNWGTALPHSGSKAYVISNHSYGQITSGDILVTPGVEYDLHAFVRGEIDPSESEGTWFLRASFYDSTDHNISYQSVAQGGPGSLDSTWEFVGGTFTPPSGTAYVRIYLISYMNSGWVAFDDVSLTKTGADPSQVYDLTYNGENRLTGIDIDDVPKASFVYDGDGNRVKATVNGVTTYYLGNYLEWTGSTATMKKYYYAGSRRIAVRVGTGTDTSGLTWLFGDHLGSTTVAVDAYPNGMTSTLRYGPWGEERGASGTLPTMRRFTGQYKDSYINLYWYGSRWYDPALGRFISPDSIVPDTNNPLDWDRYAYSRNNPINYNDPDGHFPLLVTAGIGALIGGIAGGAIYAATNQNSFSDGEFWTAVGAGAVTGGLIGSGVGILALPGVAAAGGGTVTAATVMIGAGSGAAGSGAGYMLTTPDNFDTSDFAATTTVGGVVGGISAVAPGAGEIGGAFIKGGAYVVGSEAQYALTTDKWTKQGATDAAISGATGAFFDVLGTQAVNEVMPGLLQTGIGGKAAEQALKTEYARQLSGYYFVGGVTGFVTGVGGTITSAGLNGGARYIREKMESR